MNRVYFFFFLEKKDIKIGVFIFEILILIIYTFAGIYTKRN